MQPAKAITNVLTRKNIVIIIMKMIASYTVYERLQP